jgi:polysaccharide pyruvyl transferase WcaK-like protein
MVKGPIILAPISLSLIGFKHDIKLSKFLKYTLKKFSKIYVRGPYTFELIKILFDIDENKMSMCLDSGFWHLLDPMLNQLVRNGHVEKKRVRILILPRMDYFYAYNKNILYEYYLRCLKDLILRLSKKYDCEFIIASYTVDNSRFSASKAAKDLIYALKNNIEKLDLTDLVYIERPRTLIDSLRLFSSADIVVTSYMHAGIVALSAGIPTVFILPRFDIKVLDVIRYLNLPVDKFFIDMFNSTFLRSDSVLNLFEGIIKNLEYYKSVITYAVDKALPDAQCFIDNAIKLVAEY